MPRIFDNISDKLVTALDETLRAAARADFCVGYFNMRGWRLLGSAIDQWEGAEQQVRLIIGMPGSDIERVRDQYSIYRALRDAPDDDDSVDNGTKKRRQTAMKRELRDQLMMGLPTDSDEQALRMLARHLRQKRVIVKLFTAYPLHAKLYLVHQPDNYSTPIHAFLGSSNLTLAGLRNQGELNTEVTDYDAAQKLKAWFDARWDDDASIDVTDMLLEILDESWARETTLPPYEIYLKMVYHLAQDAIEGTRPGKFPIPKDLRAVLFPYQESAVQIAAQHLNQRGGVLLGDVVGLGKTLMATAVARIFQEDQRSDVLVLCPPNLKTMWESYLETYRLLGEVMSVYETAKLDQLRRYQLIIIDESHNLRNRQGKRYKQIQAYIARNESKVILLSATPYNKKLTDLSAQLRLFLDEDRDIGIRPEQYLRSIGGEIAFTAKHQTSPRSIAAFEKSDHMDDWRDLMRLYLVRRTRSFIIRHYAQRDESGRAYLTLSNGSRSYFPVRVPKTAYVPQDDQFARLFSDMVVETVNMLSLSRYGLVEYLAPGAEKQANDEQKQILENLSRAGARLIGFTRTNLFKRLESSGPAFLQTVERHILRNQAWLHALTHDLPVPIGTLEVRALSEGDIERDDIPADGDDTIAIRDDARAADIYAELAGAQRKRYDWLPAAFFSANLVKALQDDIDGFQRILAHCGAWNRDADAKLAVLTDLLMTQHRDEKVLIFSQFADTVQYITAELARRGVDRFAAVSGDSDNPRALAERFSPLSNNAKIKSGDELRVLVATDVLSEGQNLQDAHIVINYDLPWAIIRLIQRVGRVDRIGQRAESILCYSFLPERGIEAIIRLRARVSERLAQNADVVGSDERFFDDAPADANGLRDLYTERAGILDADGGDEEIDLASYAYQIWQDATRDDDALRQRIEKLPGIVYSTRAHAPTTPQPAGVITYVQTGDGADLLAWVDEDGQTVTESYFAILNAAKCTPDTPHAGRHPDHHQLVGATLKLLTSKEYHAVGALGPPNKPRSRAYDVIKRYIAGLEKDAPLLITPALKEVQEDLYKYKLQSGARDSITRQLRSGISDEDFARMLMRLRDEDKLSLREERDTPDEPRVRASLGLVPRR